MLVECRGVHGSPAPNELSARSRTVVYGSTGGGGGSVTAHGSKNPHGYSSTSISAVRLAVWGKRYTCPGGGSVKRVTPTVRLQVEWQICRLEPRFDTVLYCVILYTCKRGTAKGDVLTWFGVVSFRTHVYEMTSQSTITEHR